MLYGGEEGGGGGYYTVGSNDNVMYVHTIQGV